MLLELDDGFVPKDVIVFLEKTIRLSYFESTKREFQRDGSLPLDKVVEHVSTAHSLINFWKNMFFCQSAKVNFVNSDDSDLSEEEGTFDFNDDDLGLQGVQR